MLAIKTMSITPFCFLSDLIYNSLDNLLLRIENNNLSNIVRISLLKRRQNLINLSLIIKVATKRNG